MKNGNDSAAAPSDRLGGLARLLGIEIVEQRADRVVATMPVTTDHHQPLGYLHGGASVVLAETVASLGAWIAAPEGRVPLGMEINANHLATVRAGTVTATATPLHVGRQSQVWHIEIRDGHQRLCCISRCTVAVVERRQE